MKVPNKQLLARSLTRLREAAQKHADYYGCDWMICEMDDCGDDPPAFYSRPLTYAQDPEFQAFDGRILEVIEPRPACV